MSAFADRIAELSERARRDCESFEPPLDPPDDDRALEYLVDGAGDALALYVEARTDGMARLDDAEFALLERAFNDYLQLYAACYGADLAATFTLREAAELLFDTHSIRETALLLTRIPERDRSEGWASDGA